MKCCRLLETLGRRVKERLAGSPRSRLLLCTHHCFPGSLVGGHLARFPRGSKAVGKDCKHLPTGARQEAQGAGWVVREVVETVAKKKASHG